MSQQEIFPQENYTQKIRNVNKNHRALSQPEPNPSEVIYKPKQCSYIGTKLFFVEIFLVRIFLVGIFHRTQYNALNHSQQEWFYYIFLPNISSRDMGIWGR